MLNGNVCSYSFQKKLTFKKIHPKRVATTLIFIIVFFGSIVPIFELPTAHAYSYPNKTNHDFTKMCLIDHFYLLKYDMPCNINKPLTISIIKPDLKKHPDISEDFFFDTMLAVAMWIQGAGLDDADTSYFKFQIIDNCNMDGLEEQSVELTCGNMVISLAEKEAVGSEVFNDFFLNTDSDLTLAAGISHYLSSSTYDRSSDQVEITKPGYILIDPFHKYKNLIQELDKLKRLYHNHTDKIDEIQTVIKKWQRSARGRETDPNTWAQCLKLSSEVMSLLDEGEIDFRGFAVKSGGPPLFNIIIHELGHAIFNLQHANVSFFNEKRENLFGNKIEVYVHTQPTIESVMATGASKSLPLGKSFSLFLTSDDIAGAKSAFNYYRIIPLRHMANAYIIQNKYEDFLRVLTQGVNLDHGFAYLPNEYDKTLLVTASENGRMGMVKALIDHNAPINGSPFFEDTPLMAAAHNGHLNVVKLLLTHKASVNKKSPKFGYTALMLASSKGHLDIVEYLLAKRSKSGLGDSDFRTALHFACFLKGNTKIIKRLLTAGADIHSRSSLGDTALIIAAKYGDTDMVRMLLDHGADVIAQNNYGFTALKNPKTKEIRELLLNARGKDAPARADEQALLAEARVKCGNIQKVKALLEKGVDVNTKDTDGVTVLMLASQSCQPEIVKVLLDNGADVNMRDDNGSIAYNYTPRVMFNPKPREIHELLEKAGSFIPVPGLIDAAKEGNLSYIEEKIAKNADVDSVDRLGMGFTALMGAAENGYLEIVKALLAHGADIHKKNNGGGSTLHYASSQGSVEIVNLLLAKGAEANSITNKGDTVLMNAANPEIVKALLTHGANIHKKNNMGASALHYASYYGRYKVVEILIKHGADVNSKAGDGQTALDFAKSEPIKQLLVQAGAEN